MIKIERTETYGWEAAIRGMRNPLNSWDKSDSDFQNGTVTIGENDLSLMKRLSKAGSDHGKYLRMIHVQCDIVAPAYFTAELDTYKVGTTRNSCSLQHKGSSRDFTAEDFSVGFDMIYDILDGNSLCLDPNLSWLSTEWRHVINALNNLRAVYYQTGDYRFFIALRSLMPMGYNYRFTWDTNYAVLKNIYHSRKNHKLEEWHTLCDWIEQLPYAEGLIYEC